MCFNKEMAGCNSTCVMMIINFNFNGGGFGDSSNLFPSFFLKGDSIDLIINVHTKEMLIFQVEAFLALIQSCEACSFPW